MEEKRMNKEELLELVKSIDIDSNEFTVLSSGALVLRGIFDNAGDLDIAVTEKGLQELREHYDLTEKNGMGGIWYVVSDKVECVLDDMNGKRELLDGFYLQDINDYLNYLKSSDRDKDKARIPLVEQYIENRKKQGKGLV